MYYECYALLVQYIYENPEALTPYQELVCTNLATAMCLMCILLPFLLCFWWCKVIFK